MSAILVSLEFREKDGWEFFTYNVELGARQRAVAIAISLLDYGFNFFLDGSGALHMIGHKNAGKLADRQET